MRGAAYLDQIHFVKVIYGWWTYNIENRDDVLVIEPPKEFDLA